MDKSKSVEEKTKLYLVRELVEFIKKGANEIDENVLEVLKDFSIGHLSFDELYSKLESMGTFALVKISLADYDESIGIEEIKNIVIKALSNYNDKYD